MRRSRKMPRALTVQRTLVTPPEREKFAQKLLRTHEYYASAGCRYTVYEEAGLPGAFLEFFEAPDAATLARAHAAAPDRVLDPARIYHEVELP
jgi:hypothetical protein